MATYTVSIIDLINNGFDFGMDKYPIFDESYRQYLNQKIIDHYMFREIGMDTPGAFKFVLNRALNEHMPLFNQKYESLKIQIMPLLTRDEKETTKRVIEGGHNNHIEGTDNLAIEDDKHVDTDGSVTTNGTLDVKRVQSDTPDGILNMSDIESSVFASKVDIDADTSYNKTDSEDHDTTHDEGSRNRTIDNTLSGTVNSEDNFTRALTGTVGNQSKLLIEYRKTFLNVDMEVIESLGDCFLGLW